jgi:hypothetical protein
MAMQMLAALPPVFDSHDAERVMQRLHPAAFQREQDRFRKAKDPLKSFSQSFGMWLALHFKGHISKTATRPKTLSLRNTFSENQQWEKV